jgi:hypothetical protein
MLLAPTPCPGQLLSHPHPAAGTVRHHGLTGTGTRGPRPQRTRYARRRVRAGACVRLHAAARTRPTLRARAIAPCCPAARAAPAGLPCRAAFGAGKPGPLGFGSHREDAALDVVLNLLVLFNARQLDARAVPQEHHLPAAAAAAAAAGMRAGGGGVPLRKQPSKAWRARRRRHAWRPATCPPICPHCGWASAIRQVAPPQAHPTCLLQSGGTM